MRALWFLGLMACGRDATEADVRMVGVGSDPEEIGPSPTAYGGVVEYDHVELAGGGLALAHMGLGSYDEVGPGGIGFAPPYAGIIGFSYLFDTKLTAADTLAFVGATPPTAEDTCYTSFSPEGPIGSFTTLDVGDYMQFETTDGSSRFRMGRVPADYPPDPQDLFIYYSSVEEYAPYSRTHPVPVDGDANPRSMAQQVWKYANYPFGSEMVFSFPGGFSRFDQPVGSIPRPSSSVGNTSVQLPDALGGVLLEWDGPRYDNLGELLSEDGLQSRCIEYYGERETAPASAVDCDTPAELPGDDTYDSFVGQIYTGPWDAADGRVNFHWTPKEHGDQVALTVRFMAAVDRTNPDYLVPQVDGRPALACEEEDAEFVLDESLFPDGEPALALQGDPMSRMAEVTCLLKDDGEYSLKNEQLEDALEYAQAHGAGGAVFFLSRGTETEVEVPAAKDQYDQKHDITPIKVTTRAVRVGRFHWSPVSTSGGEE